MQIRDYQADDYAQILPLMKAFKNEECSYDTGKCVVGLTSDEKAVKYADQIMKDVKERNGYFYIAEEDEKIAGFVMGIVGEFEDLDPFAVLTHEGDRTGWIGIIYVDPEHRGNGLSRQLIDRAKEYLKNKGCETIKLQVLTENPAVNVYKKIGFRSNSQEMLLDL